jgi:Arc/MetJ-type ribon-helix-helix transcriptional regulator
MDKRQKIFHDAEKIVKFIDECVKKGYFPSDDDVIFQFKLSDRMLKPRLELAWKMHREKPEQNWEAVVDEVKKKREEQWKKFDALEEVERKKIEKLELEKELERTKDPMKRIVIIRRLQYFDNKPLAVSY